MASKKTPDGYWTRERCFEEAQKYKTKTEFQKNSPSAYSISWRNGWLNDYNWFIEICKPTSYWTKMRCAEESKKYKTRTEFQKKSPGAYTAAWRNGWLDEITPHMKKRTYDESSFADNRYIIYIYKDKDNKVAYVGLTNNIKRRHKEHTSLNTKNDVVREYFSINAQFPTILYENLSADEAMQKEEETYYQYKSNGWCMLNEENKLGSIGCAHQKWTRSKCRKEAKKYKTLKEFRTKSKIAYEIASNNNWTEEYTWLKREQHSTWSEQKCHIEAKKYKTIKDFKNNSSSAYSAAIRNNWLKDYTWLKYERISKTEEECFNEAKKYLYVKDFKNNSYQYYTAAQSHGWLKNYTWLIRLCEHNKWTQTETFKEAQKYDYLCDFRKQSKGAYSAAYKNNWLKDYTWLIHKK